MAFFVNLGYQFGLAKEIKPEGSIISSSTMPMHQLMRRKFTKKTPHLSKRYFDPQLYLASYDAAGSKKHCANLASYPWFGIEGYQSYKSAELTQKQWKDIAVQTVVSHWKQSAPTDPEVIKNAVRECIEFQERMGCHGIILPSPLTADSGTTYSQELLWLDSALEYLRNRQTLQPRKPVFATIALTDLCLRYVSPLENKFLSLILDTISAREVDGVYIVVEQASETELSRHCGTSRTLQSVLHLV